MQHLDSPDNNPDLPWEFTDANKEKVRGSFIEIIEQLQVSL